MARFDVDECISSAAHLGDPQTKLLVAGPPRTGTTFLASLLAKLGVDFGLATRSWDINSGYYEHPKLLKIYGQIRKYERMTSISDNFAASLQQSAVRGIKDLLSSVDALKYPPISAQLPYLIARAGFTPVLAISVRLFEPYAISRMRMEGIGYQRCKEDYLEIYRSLLLLLKIYKGEVIPYEELISQSPARALRGIHKLCGANMEDINSVVLESVGKPRSFTGTLNCDSECRDVYDQLLTIAV